MVVKCPICSGEEHELVTDRVRFGNRANVLRCRRCSLVYLDQGSFDLPANFYEGDYHQTYITHVEPSAFDPESYYKKMLVATKPWGDRINELLTGEESVLDFGCSTGHLMTLVRDKTKDICGFEVNKKEIEFCRNALGLDVSGGSLDEYCQDRTFDYITMIFVLEHIAQPVQLLNSLKRFLRPGGKFIILVPSIDDPLLSFYSIPEYAEFYFCIEHLYYYSAKTIRYVFNQAGLRGDIQILQEYPVINHLNWGYRKKPSDVLASRRSIPDIPVADATAIPEWEDFWQQVDRMYKSFVSGKGFGDRLWCIVG